MNKYELKSFEDLKEELGEKYDKFMYEMNVELVRRKLGTLDAIDRTIEIIKQQPSHPKEDSWILSRLYGIRFCLNGNEDCEVRE